MNFQVRDVFGLKSIAVRTYKSKDGSAYIISDAGFKNIKKLFNDEMIVAVDKNNSIRKVRINTYGCVSIHSADWSQLEQVMSKVGV